MRALTLCLALSACAPLWTYGQELHPFQGGQITVHCPLPLEGCSAVPELVGW